MAAYMRYATYLGALRLLAWLSKLPTLAMVHIFLMSSPLARLRTQARVRTLAVLLTLSGPPTLSGNYSPS